MDNQLSQRKEEWEKGVQSFLTTLADTQGWVKSHEKLGVQVYRQDTDSIAIIKVQTLPPLTLPPLTLPRALCCQQRVW